MAVVSRGEACGMCGVLGEWMIVAEEEDLFYFVAPQTSRGVLHGTCLPRNDKKLLEIIVMFAGLFERQI